MLHASAADAFRGDSHGDGEAQKGESSEKSSFFGNLTGAVTFAAYYFDGCGGHAPVVSNMITAALEARSRYGNELVDAAVPDADRGNAPRRRPPSPVAVGFSLVGGGRDVVDKEVEVCRAVVECAKALGYREVRHALDDPWRHGLDPDTKKVEGSTLTSWLVLE